MKVILVEDVRGLGLSGDLVEVKPGYGNNFLLPQKLAVPATPENLNVLKTQTKARAAKAQQRLEEATETGKLIKGKKVTLEMRGGEGGRIYGAVTNQDIADELAKMGHEVDRRDIVMKEQMKSAGTYECEVRLHPEVTVPFFVEIKVFGEDGKVHAHVKEEIPEEELTQEDQAQEVVTEEDQNQEEEQTEEEPTEEEQIQEEE